MNAFSPGRNTKSIDVGAASANVLITDAEGETQIRVKNSGTADAFIQFGTDNTVAATLAGSMPVGAGVTEVLTVGDGPIYVAAIAAGATGKIYFTPGAGI